MKMERHHDDVPFSFLVSISLQDTRDALEDARRHQILYYSILSWKMLDVIIVH